MSFFTLNKLFIKNIKIFNFKYSFNQFSSIKYYKNKYSINIQLYLFLNVKILCSILNK